MMPKRRLPPGVLDEEDLKDLEDEDYEALRDLVEKELAEPYIGYDEYIA